MSEPLSREEELFAAIAPLAPAARAAALDRLGGGDVALRTAVESLLRAHDRAGAFLEHTAVSATPAEEAIGSRIGRYKLLEKIGEGGCGTVYRAEQEEPVRREVAVKVIKLGMDTQAVIARFEAERQALALMEHPNIARVLDAGATTAGRPFFVMELVRGAPITDYCDQERLPTQARLELFTQVCHAVQHAHQKGVIHRDLKPSNVLVAVHEGRAVPKIIDFGIAKATQGRLVDHTVFTAVEQFVGTPAYMSPEQADGGAVDVDTRSDIYSLGVLLYELLTGEPPFDPKALRAAGLEEVRRIVREVEPPRPSARLTTLADATRTTIAERRKTVPLHLSALLRGDLDWIVMRCLEKDRVRRYETAVGLAADIQRHLQHEPISARPPSAAYALRKFARRHRVAFSVAAAMLLVLTGAAIISTWQAVRATRAEQFAATQQHLAEQRLRAEQRARRDADEQKTRAEQERARAEAARKDAQTEAAASKAISDFLRDDLLRQADPEREPDRDIKLRTVLDRAAQRIEGRFVDQPAVEGALRETLARTYHSLGDFASSQRHLERAIELMRQTRGPDHPRTLSLSSNLVTTLSAQGKFREAEELGLRMVDTLTRVLGPEANDTLATMGNLSLVYGRQGKLKEAAALGEKTLAAKQRALGPDHPSTLGTLNNLANTYRLLRRFGEAETLFRQLLDQRQRTLGPNRPETLGVRFNLAALALDQRRFADAEPLFVELLRDEKRVLGPEHPETLNAARSLGLVYLRRQKLDEAEPLLTETAAVQKHVLGPEHPHSLATLIDLAAVYCARKRLSDAETILQQCLPACRRVYGPEHPATQDAMNALADVFEAQQRYAAMEPLLVELQALTERRAKADSNNANLTRLREATSRLQRFYAAASQPEKAAEWKRRVDDMPAGPTPASP